MLQKESVIFWNIADRNPLDRKDAGNSRAFSFFMDFFFNAASRQFHSLYLTFSYFDSLLYAFN